MDLIKLIFEPNTLILPIMAGLVFFLALLSTFAAKIDENIKISYSIVIGLLLDFSFIFLYLMANNTGSSSGGLFIAAAALGYALFLLFFIPFTFIYFLLRVITIGYIASKIYPNGISKTTLNVVRVYLIILILLLFQPFAALKIREMKLAEKERKVTAAKVEIIKKAAMSLDVVANDVVANYPDHEDEAQVDKFVHLYEPSEKAVAFEYSDDYFWSKTHLVQPLQTTDSTYLRYSLQKKYWTVDASGSITGGKAGIHPNANRLKNLILVDDGKIDKNDSVYYDLPNISEYRRLSAYDYVDSVVTDNGGYIYNPEVVIDEQKVLVPVFGVIVGKIDDGWILVGYEEPRSEYDIKSFKLSDFGNKQILAGEKVNDAKVLELQF